MSDHSHQSGDAASRAMMDNLYWWGIPSLFRAAIADNPADLDIALVGVPHSTGNGTTERDQHLGPRAVRHVSANMRRAHMRYGFYPLETGRIGDIGDVPLPEANNNEACIKAITSFFRQIDAAGARPVSIGGDHSITGGILRAISGQDSRLTNGGKVALLHLDAHADTFESLEHFLGAKDSAAHWASYLVHEGHVDASCSLQIGLRGNARRLDWLEPSHRLGYEVITMEDYRQIAFQDVVAKIRAVIGDMPVYITFDLDCLDPTVAPAVSNIEPGVAGFGIDEAIGLVQAVKGLNVIGGDVVCLMPTKDSPNNITAMVAASLAYEIPSQIAWYKHAG